MLLSWDLFLSTRLVQIYAKWKSENKKVSKDCQIESQFKILNFLSFPLNVCL